ncbi:MAG: hypothetical protein K6G88_10535 [Lachnospiraceae bacterium]|jgi:hypothetical protein|nr:hypothetical protein [Lachnospiraceae bacterium]
MYVAKHFYPHIAIFIPFLIMLAGFNLPKLVSHQFKTKLVPLIFICAGAFVFIISVDEYFALYKNVYMTYKNGEYLKCSGKVENLVLITSDGHGVDEFDVDNVHFEVGNLICPGYQKIAAWGGMINEEGLDVEIVYINFNEMNYIMELKVLSKD